MWYHVAFVPWPPHEFPGSLFINCRRAHVVFERFTDKEWRILLGTSDGLDNSLEQVAWVPATQREEKKNSLVTIKNYLLKHIGVTIFL